MAQTRPRIMVRLSEAVVHSHCIRCDNKGHGMPAGTEKCCTGLQYQLSRKQPKHHIQQTNVQGFFEFQRRKMWSVPGG